MLSVSDQLIQPELLDTLSPESTDARHSRRDLRVINFLMGNHRWIIRSVQARLRHQERLIEIGAGGGELCQKLAGRGMVTAGLDRWPGPGLTRASFGIVPTCACSAATRIIRRSSPTSSCII